LTARMETAQRARMAKLGPAEQAAMVTLVIRPRSGDRDGLQRDALTCIELTDVGFKRELLRATDAELHSVTVESVQKRAFPVVFDCLAGDRGPWRLGDEATTQHELSRRDSGHEQGVQGVRSSLAGGQSDYQTHQWGHHGLLCMVCENYYMLQADRERMR
jgi:hypothetical protein